MSFALSKYLERRQSKFHYQFSERLLSERLIKIIDPICVDAVFTKQLYQISARRSGRFFVDGDFIFCHVEFLYRYFKLSSIHRILQWIVGSCKWIVWVGELLDRFGDVPRMRRLKVLRFFVSEDAGFCYEAKAEWDLERKARTAPLGDVDRELGMLPEFELVLRHIEIAAGDFAEPHVA